MKYDVACVDDVGDKLAVKYVDTYQNSLARNDGYYIKISNVAADVIREALANSNRVWLPKNVDGELGVADVVISETDGLEKDKMVAIASIYGKVDYQLFHISAFDHFNYLNMFSKLASKGIFITDENKEEKYIEIIEKGDEAFITLLEDYLEAKDKLEAITYVYKKSVHAVNEIIKCESPEKLAVIVDEFNSK